MVLVSVARLTLTLNLVPGFSCHSHADSLSVSVVVVCHESGSRFQLPLPRRLPVCQCGHGLSRIVFLVSAATPTPTPFCQCGRGLSRIVFLVSAATPTPTPCLSVWSWSVTNRVPGFSCHCHADSLSVSVVVVCHESCSWFQLPLPRRLPVCQCGRGLSRVAFLVSVATPTPTPCLSVWSWSVTSLVPGFSCHCHADSLFSTSSGFTNYRGILNLCIVLLVSTAGGVRRVANSWCHATGGNADLPS